MNADLVGERAEQEWSATRRKRRAEPDAGAGEVWSPVRRGDRPGQAEGVEQRDAQAADQQAAMASGAQVVSQNAAKPIAHTLSA